MSTFSDAYIHVNGNSLHYYRTGGNKPSIILLHGFTDNGLCWTRIARALEPEYDVIMVDARGHGLSEGPTVGFSTQFQVDDIADFIQSLSLDRPFLLGHSMGAATAAVIAAQHPDLVRAVVLEDPPWRANITSPPEKMQENQLQKPSDHPWYAWLADLKAQAPEERIKTAHSQNPDWPEEELSPWADAKEQFNFDVLRYNTPSPPWRETVRTITCPILLITSDPEKGAIVTPEVAQEASHLWKDGRVIHITGVGHNIRRGKFDEYKNAVTTFLKEH